MTHFTAWLTFDPTCLDGDTADVSVLADEAAGERTDEHGNTVTEWTSTGDPLFHADTGIHHTGDRQKIADRAQELLAAEGWDVAADKWADVPTGLVIEVTYTPTVGDRVIVADGAVRASSPNTGAVVKDVDDDDTVMVELDDHHYVTVPIDQLTVVFS